MIIDHTGLKNALEIMAIGNRFKVFKMDPGCTCYEYKVEDTESPVMAFVGYDGGVEYAVSQIPGGSFAKIDVASLDAMRKFISAVDVAG